MDVTYPKLKDAEMLSGGILLLTFDNSEHRYLMSHYNQQISKSFTSGTNFIHGLASSRGPGFGNVAEVQPDGSLIVNDKDVYTPQELWENSSEHIATMTNGN
jgi:hypothetical protein